MQGALRSWSKKNFGYVTKEIEALRGELEEHQLDPMVERQEIRRITDRMDELLYREEMMWLQRSRLTWLKEGDRNTKYFHKQAVSRAPKNRIKKLKDSIGIWREDTQELQQMSRDFFRLYLLLIHALLLMNCSLIRRLRMLSFRWAR